MWLINTTSLELHQFLGEKPPPYAILSHCWSGDEMNFKDFRRKRRCTGPGYDKIVRFCALLRSRPFGVFAVARTAPLQWAWVDTVCIDKRSSAELSEAINSMWNWYRHAEVCFTYLADVTADAEPADDVFCQPYFKKENEPEYFQQFRQSRWFTRGWTLQELLAPDEVLFVDVSWRVIGLRDAAPNCGNLPDSYRVYRHGEEAYPAVLTNIVESITHIPRARMTHYSRMCEWQQWSVAQRMAWASHRQVSRPEDLSYCLMGLFDINMPLLYGEGGDKAFRRLQQEILREHVDDSLFAWLCRGANRVYDNYSLFARSPADFESSTDVEKATGVSETLLSVKGQGFLLEVPSAPQQAVFFHSGVSDTLLLRLQCCRRRGEGREAWLSPLIMILHQQQNCGHYLREHPYGPKSGLVLRETESSRTESGIHCDVESPGPPPLQNIQRQPKIFDEESIVDPTEWLAVQQRPTYYIHGDFNEHFDCSDVNAPERKVVRRRLGDVQKD